MTGKEVQRLLEADGWQFVKATGSHYHFKHPVKPGKVTVPMHGTCDITRASLHSILKQAGLK